MPSVEWKEAEPVFKMTYRLLNEEDRVTPDAVCDALGRSAGDERTIRALALLYEHDLIGGLTVDQSPAPIFIQTTPKGLSEAGGWPGEGSSSQQVELLLALLDERIESDETSEGEKGKLRQIRDGVSSASRDLMVAVLGAYISQATGASG
jgi:hypothetical protein